MYFRNGYKGHKKEEIMEYLIDVCVNKKVFVKKMCADIK